LGWTKGGPRTFTGVVAPAAEAVRQFVELNEWQIAAIEEGVREADRGQFIDHAKLKAKWEKKLAAAMDKAR